MTYLYRYDSPLGEIWIESNGSALTGLRFGKEQASVELREISGSSEMCSALEKTIEWLDIYFSGKEPSFTPPLYIEGTPFRKAVLEILRTIPYGKTMTYGEIATIIAREQGVRKMSAQAVGGAVGRNPIGIIIPCHCVVGANGNLTGFAGGIEKKIELLKIENIDMSAFYIPRKKK